MLYDKAPDRLEEERIIGQKARARVPLNAPDTGTTKAPPLPAPALPVGVVDSLPGRFTRTHQQLLESL
jgi:hypothetical protein